MLFLVLVFAQAASEFILIIYCICFRYCLDASCITYMLVVFVLVTHGHMHT